MQALKILKSSRIEFFKNKKFFIDEVSFSKNVFIPLSNACRNRCAYCGFVSENPDILDKRKVKSILELGAKYKCREALFTMGEKPESNKKIKKKLKKFGYSSTIEYLYDLCREALKYKLLPHSNVGVASMEELKALREVNASLGLMLENVSERLCAKGMPHEHSPGKNPKLRIKTIELAGKLKIPFTTGLLIGIGETYDEIYESLLCIRELNEKYGHIQEVIIQNFKPKKGTPMENFKEPSTFKLLKVTYASRVLLETLGIQVPPNLNKRWQLFLFYGANDLGGVSPATIDYINPEAPWPRIEELRRKTNKLGIRLKERLPIYEKFIEKGWYSEEIGEIIDDNKSKIC